MGIQNSMATVTVCIASLPNSYVEVWPPNNKKLLFRVMALKEASKVKWGHMGKS